MSNTKNNIDLLKDESFKELMYWTAKAQVGVSDVSVNLAKKHLLNDLLLDVINPISCPSEFSIGPCLIGLELVNPTLV